MSQPMSQPMSFSIGFLLLASLFGCDAQDEATVAAPDEIFRPADEADASDEADEAYEADSFMDDGSPFEADPQTETRNCPYGGQVQADTPLSASIKRACATWEKQRPHQYSFILERSGPEGGHRPIRIDVAGQNVLGARDMDNRPVDTDGLGTINDLFFDLAELAEGEPHQMVVDYDEQTGVPEFVAVDRIATTWEDQVVMVVELLGGEQD